VSQKRVRTKKAKPVDAATPVIRKPKNTDGEKISVTRSMTTAMKSAPLWNTSPALQTAVQAWNTVVDAVESNAKSIADAKTHLATLEATQRAHRHDWGVATKQVTVVATVACQGSPDQVHSLGFDVQTRVSAGQQPAPSGLVTVPETVGGAAAVSWQRGTARHAFLVQHATDVANPATVSAPIGCTKTKFTLAAPSGSIVHFRVAAIDPTVPTGLSPWSDWVACTVL
jgi:hypothetical protein